MTKDENSILAQIAVDVGTVKETVARIDVKVEGLQAARIDHETRIRDLEKNQLSRKGVVPWLTVSLLFAGVAYNFLHAAGKI